MCSLALIDSCYIDNFDKILSTLSLFMACGIVIGIVVGLLNLTTKGGDMK
jgi:F0F1-type ATP synthase assembly protein I